MAPGVHKQTYANSEVENQRFNEHSHMTVARLIPIYCARIQTVAAVERRFNLNILLLKRRYSGDI